MEGDFCVVVEEGHWDFENVESSFRANEENCVIVNVIIVEIGDDGHFRTSVTVV